MAGNSPDTISRRKLLGVGAGLITSMAVPAVAQVRDAQGRGGRSTSAPAFNPNAPGGLFPTVETVSGKIGGLARGDIKEFRGVPYGASTAGPNRFMPPKPPQPWAGVRDCLGYGQVAPQEPADASFSDYVAMISWDRHAGVGGMGEDCLNLNIWTPGLRDGRARPVLVSFHGGGFGWGSANGPMFDGNQLAKYGDVVVVTVNHRLGSLGYTHLADIGAPAEFRFAGVAGAMDMVAALKWVRNNIEHFGGDKNRVMIFGQSGGGRKVSTLMGLPSARGLFQRAAIQSGSQLRNPTRQVGTEQAEKLLKALGLPRSNIARIRDLPWQQVLQAQLASGVSYYPVVDGEFQPHDPFDPGAPLESADVPMIISTTRHDASHNFSNFDLDEPGLAAALKAKFGDAGGRILAEYRRENPTQSPFLVQAEISTDESYRRNAITQAERKAKLNRAPVFMYQWDWISPAFDGKYGASHVNDVTSSFHLVRDPSAGAGIGKGPLMCDRMASTWVAFANSGNPNNALIPQWPAYEPTRRATMVFDETMRVENDYHGNYVRMISAATTS